MGKSSSDYERDGLRTLILLGRTGNGKSATGNSILGKKEFLSRVSSVVVTGTSEMRTTVLEDGQMLNVIDTPGLVDSYVDTESIRSEIVKGIGMASEGVHAVLVVLSIRHPFSKGEAAAISRLRAWFGNKIYDYMIVVFTGGDELEENGLTLEDLLEDYHGPLKETLSLCENRYFLFDNRTEDQNKRAYQLHNLFSLVNMVSTKNSGKPYTDEIFSEFKVELRLKETTFTPEQQLAEEQISRLKAEELAYATQIKSNDKIPNVRENLE